MVYDAIKNAKNSTDSTVEVFSALSFICWKDLCFFLTKFYNGKEIA
jgi:hypothetical protein